MRPAHQQAVISLPHDRPKSLALSGGNFNALSTEALSWSGVRRARSHAAQQHAKCGGGAFVTRTIGFEPATPWTPCGPGDSL